VSADELKVSAGPGAFALQRDGYVKYSAEIEAEFSSTMSRLAIRRDLFEFVLPRRVVGDEDGPNPAAWRIDIGPRELLSSRRLGRESIFHIIFR